MKTPIALAIFLLLTLSSTSQTKPDVSDNLPVRNVTLGDLRLVIESNELGKKARAKVPILEAIQARQDSIIQFQQQKIFGRDTVILLQRRQIDSLYKAYNNSQQVIANMDTIVFARELQIRFLEDEKAQIAKATKRKNFWRTVKEAIFVSAVAAYVYIKEFK